MVEFLIMRLNGVLQAWGEHTYEDYRPTAGFPTRSGLLGLLASCLGIDRNDLKAQADLNASLWFSVRAEDRDSKARALKISDFHTVLDARKVNIRKSSEYPVVSRREYLCDACFSVVLELSEQAVFSLDQIEAALKRPVYTPVLGRRSCALSQPLFAARVVADNALVALQSWRPCRGRIYSDSPALVCDRELRQRDQPLNGRVRQFGTRRVFVHHEEISDAGK